MRVAVIGSRNIEINNLGEYLPKGVTEIVSGGAPLNKNLQIVEYADLVIAFWDGKSNGTRYTIESCKRMGKIVKVIIRD